MKNLFKLLLLILGSGCATQSHIYQSFQFRDDVESRWISFENPTGAKGSGGQSNGGAKGQAFTLLKAGESRTIADIDGMGIIHRLWMTGGFVYTAEDRRNITIEIFWDGDTKAAVSAPLHDFFGMSQPLKVPFENAFFSQPEGRSYNCTVDMPFRKGAKVVVTNHTQKEFMMFFDLNYSLVKRLPRGTMYFHAYWHRDTSTQVARDFEILPRIEGSGRYLGTTVGVIGNPLYRDSWFGEGEVKIFMDGDDQYPTLCGTGTEDYIGTGWGQLPYANRLQGSPIADPVKGVYSFYRLHTVDPIYFSEDCRVTIQQMGNATTSQLRDMISNGAKALPNSVWHDGGLRRINDGECEADIQSEKFLDGGVNYWRSDDVCSTVYFYLDRTSTSLPSMQSQDVRLHNLGAIEGADTH